MNWNSSVRQIHRWLSIAFTVAVIVNVVAMVQEKQAVWIGILALLPLFLLLLTGLYMFVLPYATKWRSARGAADRSEGNGRARRPRSRRRSQRRPRAKPVLLSGGNPQIAKGVRRRPRAGLYRGHAGLETRRRAPPRRAHRAHRPRRAQGSQMELALLRHRGPSGWFLSFHCFTKYVKVAFFRGTSLRPLPPGESKHKEVRYLDIREDEPLDEAQLAAWVKQASQLPGERM